MTTGRRAALPLTLLLAVTGCSSGDGGSGGEDASGPSSADVAFAKDSLEEHTEVLLLVDEAARRGVPAAVTTTLDEIRAQRTADIEALTDLLEGWDETVPATARDHANAGHGAAQGHEDLADEQGADFEEAWLDLAADQHEEALEVAEAEVEEGRDAAAVRLAREMAARLEQQIAELERLEG